MKGVLVIVPCGQAKIWDREPTHGPTAARDAYTGGPFRVNRRYAEKFGERWVILSAKYGFIYPDFLIPGPYNVTFKKPSTSTVSLAALKEQVRKNRLDKFEVGVVLGGVEYQHVVEETFRSSSVRVLSPFAGLPIGRAMQATIKATEANEPGIGLQDRLKRLR